MSGALLVGPLIHIGTLAPFRALSHGQLTAVALASDEIVYEEGAWMVRQGEPARAMLMIVDGYAERVTEDGSRSTIAPGDVVGFPEVLVPAPTTFGVQAHTEIVALRLETDALRELCEHNFAILAALLTHVARSVASDPRASRRALAGAAPSAPLDGEQPLDRVGRLLALHRAPTLPSDSMDALADLAGRIGERRLAAGEGVWSAGQAADGFWVVASGEIELTPGVGPTLSVGVGGVPGFVETLAGGHYEGTARATRPTSLLHVPLDPFMDVIEDHFELAFSLLGRLASHVVAPPRLPRLAEPGA